MILKERDLKLLTDLHYVRCLNSKRISVLFGNYNSAMRRLKQLERNKYVRISDFLLSREAIWSLDKNGFNIINGEYYQVNKSANINHILACADFYFYLKQQEHDIKHYSMDELISFKYRNKKYKFRPDIILRTDRWYLVEIDLSGRRFDEKVKRWEAYYSSFAFLEKFNLFPPILIVSSNINKARSAIDKCKTIELNYAFRDHQSIGWDKYKY